MENIKSHTKTMNLIYLLQFGMANLNYLMDYHSVSHIQTFLEHINKKHETVSDNPPKRITAKKKNHN